MGSHIHRYPLNVITNVLMRVIFPALARVQDNNEELRKLFFRACGGIAFITFPMMLGLASLAEPFVLTILGENWIPHCTVDDYFCTGWDDSIYSLTNWPNLRGEKSERFIALVDL